MKNKLHSFLAIVFVAFFCNTKSQAQTIGSYVGITYLSELTNPLLPACSFINSVNGMLGDSDFMNGTYDMPLGISFSGNWANRKSYTNNPSGPELLLVSTESFAEQWRVALRLTNGTTTASQIFTLNINPGSNFTGYLVGCVGGYIGTFTLPRAVTTVEFTSYTIPPGVGVLGVVFEPIADGTGNPDPSGVIVLTGTPLLGGGPGCAIGDALPILN